MDKDDVTIVFIMNGPSCIKGSEKHTLNEFIKAKKRQLGHGSGRGAGDSSAPRETKIPRRSLPNSEN